MKKILLISVQDVKDNTVVESNVEETVIVNSIFEVQEFELSPVIGSVTYKRLLSEVEQVIKVADYVLSDSDKTLIDEYIKPFLIYSTLVNSFIPLHYKVTNKGAQTKTDGNSKAADSRELSILQTHYNTKFENYKKRLIDYIKNDEDDSTNPMPEQDSTYLSTGWLLNDDTFDYAEYINMKANKMYYRRGY